LKRHGIETIGQLNNMTYEELLHVQNMDQKSADKVTSVINSLIQTSDGKVKGFKIIPKKSITEIIQEILPHFRIIVLSDEKTGELLLLKPSLSQNVVLTVSKANYKKLKVKLDDRVRIFLPATDIGQSLCEKASDKQYTAYESIFETEKESDFVKELAQEVIYGAGNIEQIICNAIESNRECEFKTTVSRLIFGVPSAEMMTQYKIPILEKDSSDVILKDDDIFDFDAQFDIDNNSSAEENEFDDDNFNLDDLFAELDDTEEENEFDNNDFNLDDL
jgi:hypothetical protein